MGILFFLGSVVFVSVFVAYKILVTPFFVRKYDHPATRVYDYSHLVQRGRRTESEENEVQQFLRTAREKLAARHTDRCAYSGISTRRLDDQFNAAWGRIISAANAQYGSYAVDSALLRLGY